VAAEEELEEATALAMEVALAEVWAVSEAEYPEEVAVVVLVLAGVLMVEVYTTPAVTPLPTLVLVVVVVALMVLVVMADLELLLLNGGNKLILF
jgi:hypothetical protein